MPRSPKSTTTRRGPRTGHNWKPRGTASQRGYGSDWCKVRDAYTREHPLCERCERDGKVTAVDEVHHVRPFNGVHDPLRLEWSNLMSVCHECHRAMERERRE